MQHERERQKSFIIPLLFLQLSIFFLINQKCWEIFVSNSSTRRAATNTYAGMLSLHIACINANTT